MSDTEPLPNRATTPFTGTGPRICGWDLSSKKIWPPVAQTASRVQRQDGRRSKSAEWTQLARGTLNRYLLILKRLIFESSVRAGSPSFEAAPEGPEIRP